MTEGKTEIRIVVADDHLVVREGLRFMLEEADEGFVLVGDAGDGATALDVVGKVQPDVVLMDLRMPGMDGLEAIKRIRAVWPHIAVLILTTYNEDDLMIHGLQVGACSARSGQRQAGRWWYNQRLWLASSRTRRLASHHHPCHRRTTPAGRQI